MASDKPPSERKQRCPDPNGFCGNNASASYDEAMELLQAY